MPSDPRHLEFRLSEEASQRINGRIDRGELAVLWDISQHESKEKRIGLILNEAQRLLESRDLPLKGCNEEKSVREWLSGKRGKGIEVFKALCQAVDENWREVFDRSLYNEVLVGERQKLFGVIVSRFFGIDLSSQEVSSTVPGKFLESLEQILGSEQIAPETLAELLETVIKEYALDGRQIRLRVLDRSLPCCVASIEIVGHNQKGSLETWRQCYEEPYPAIVETSGWWWKGDVSIRLQGVRNGKPFASSCETFVPHKGYVWAEVSLDVVSGECKIDYRS
jgi:hypothetical protein